MGQPANSGDTGAVKGAYYYPWMPSYQSSTTGWYVPAKFNGAVQLYDNGSNGAYAVGFKYQNSGYWVTSSTTGAVQGRFYALDDSNYPGTTTMVYRSATYSCGDRGRYTCDRWYTPIKSNVTVNNPVCDTAVNQPNGKLITCVTERADLTNRYTDEYVTSGGFIGSYNQGNSGMSNYSEDGICYVAGRELPKVIPLTNQRSTIASFFANATVGGGTPGHLGTAWAWYMLSPNWSTIFTGTSAPAAYTDKTTTKAVILMTDGEYNEQYTSTASATQAAELCTAMKAKGIKVFTVGFGFDANATVGSSSADGKAKELLKNCASDNSSYFFPYDGAALRQAFKDIGNSLTSSQKTARYTK